MTAESTQQSAEKAQPCTPSCVTRCTDCWARPKAESEYTDRSPMDAVKAMLQGHDGMRPTEGTCLGCGASLGVRTGDGATWTEVAAALHRHQWEQMGVPR